MAKIEVQILGDASSLEKAFKKASRDTRKFSLSFGQIIKASAGFLGVQKAFSLIGDSIHLGITEIKEFQAVQAQTAAVLKSTGAVAGVSAKQVRQLSQSLSNVSGIDDEVIQQGQNLLLSFKNIRNEAGKGNDVFTQATKAVVDFAARTGKDIPTAAVLLGRALEDPAGKIAALSRAGIVFTKSQRDVVAQIQKTQGVMAAQKVLLEQLRERFGGAAAAAGRTLPGQLNILHERFKDLAGSIVGLLVPLATKFVPEITKIVKQMTAWSEKSENQRRIQADLTKVVQAATTTFKTIRDVVKQLIPPLEQAVKAMGGLRNAVQLLLALFVAKKVVGFSSALGGLGTSAETSTVKVNALRGALLRLGAIGIITIGIELVLNRDSIDKATTKFLKGHGLGFLVGGQTFKVPASVDLSQLEKWRDKIAKIKGDQDLLVKALDKYIAHVKKISIPTVRDRGFSRADSSAVAKQRKADQSSEAAADKAAKASEAQARAQLAAAARAKADAAAAKAAAATLSKSLTALFAKFNVQLAEARKTPGTKDDLALLKKQLQAIKDLLKAHKDNVQLQREEATLQGRITSLQQKQKAALDKTKQALADATDQAKSLFGSLFQKPDLTANNPTFVGGSRGRRTVPGTGGSAQDLLANITAQNNSFAQLTKNISSLIRRGAPSSLVKAAESGQISSDQVAALAGANQKTLNRIFAQVRRADRLIASAAKMELSAKTVNVKTNTVSIAGANAIARHRGDAALGGLTINGNVTINTNASNVKQLQAELERQKKKQGSQRRGKLGGHR